MKRSKSVTSLSTMCQFPNDYQIGYEQPDASLTERDIHNMNEILDDASMPFPIPDNQLGMPPGFPPPPPDFAQFSYSEDENDIPITVVPEDDTPACFTKCKASDLKATVSTIYNYPGGSQFSKFLSKQPGLLILPVRNVSLIRKAHGAHINDTPIIIFHPKTQAQLDNWPILKEAIDNLQ